MANHSHSDATEMSPAERLATLIQPDTRSEAEAAAARFRLSLDLFEDGVELRRASLRREFPDASAAEIEQRISAWLRDRRNERLDGQGRVLRGAELAEWVAQVRQMPR